MLRKLLITDNPIKNSQFSLFPSFLNFVRPVTCWKCGIENESNVFCEKCNVLQEPNNKSNYYDLLDLQVSYKIDAQDLVSKYHKKQILFHPDKHSNKSEKERNISENYSTLINKAYSTLSNPLDRGLYLLKLKGHPLDKENVSSTNQKLFMDILELDDEVDVAQSGPEMIQISEKVNKMIENYIDQITRAFDVNEIEKAKDLLTDLKYYVNVIHKLKVKKQKLGIPD